MLQQTQPYKVREFATLNLVSVSKFATPNRLSNVPLEQQQTSFKCATRTGTKPVLKGGAVLQGSFKVDIHTYIHTYGRWFL